MNRAATCRAGACGPMFFAAPFFVERALLVIEAHRVQGGWSLPYDPPLLAVGRATRRGAMLTLQGEHAEAGAGILASRKDLTSPHASHACLEGQACHPPRVIDRISAYERFPIDRFDRWKITKPPIWVSAACNARCTRSTGSKLTCGTHAHVNRLPTGDPAKLCMAPTSG